MCLSIQNPDFRRGCFGQSGTQTFEHRSERRVGSGHDELYPGFAIQQPYRGLQEAGAHVANLIRTRARQKRYDRLLQIQLQKAALLIAIDIRRDDIRKWMADIGCRHAGLGIDRRLEREHQQHVINRLANLLHALPAPGPNRRADEMDNGLAAGAKGQLEIQIEVRRVDANKQRGLPLEDTLSQLPSHPQ